MTADNIDAMRSRITELEAENARLQTQLHAARTRLLHLLVVSDEDETLSYPVTCVEMSDTPTIMIALDEPTRISRDGWVYYADPPHWEIGNRQTGWAGVGVNLRWFVEDAHGAILATNSCGSVRACWLAAERAIETHFPGQLPAWIAAAAAADEPATEDYS